MLSILFLTFLNLVAPVLAAPVSNATVERREILDGQQAKLLLTTYWQANCATNGHKDFTANSPVYGNNQSVGVAGGSFYITRGLLPGEQLDFSSPLQLAFPSAVHAQANKANGACQSFLKSFDSRSIPTAGCYTTPSGSSCFRLWHH